MKNNLESLLIGTSLSLIPNLCNAQCVASTDCATLGYTETSYPNGGIKCPFGNTFACPASETSVCSRYGFKYTCSGTGYEAGVGTACNNQYAYCTCSDGYEWKNDKCEAVGLTLGTCTGRAATCAIGQILNSDGSCTSDVTSGKDPLGVVIAIKDNCGYAMSSAPIAIGIAWGGYGTDISSLTNYTSSATAITDFDVRGNMTKIIQSGDAYTYRAAYVALNYAPTAALTTKGKWALPTAGILNSLYTNLNAIDNTISKLGGIQLTGDNEQIWSSSEAPFAWHFCTDSFYNDAKQSGLHYYAKNNGGNVRPVLPF